MKRKGYGSTRESRKKEKQEDKGKLQQPAISSIPNYGKEGIGDKEQYGYRNLKFPLDFSRVQNNTTKPQKLVGLMTKTGREEKRVKANEPMYPGKQGEGKRRVEMREQRGEGKAFEEGKENKKGLPPNLKAGIENMSGISMEEVKVYYNSPKPAWMGAKGLAMGKEIHVSPGQEEHLAHEAWHVVQQLQGRVKGRERERDVLVNNQRDLEREAEEMGRKAENWKGKGLGQGGGGRDRHPRKKEMERGKEGVTQLLRIGRIPNQPFRQGNVRANAAYENLQQTSALQHDVGDFTQAMSRRFLQENSQFFANNPNLIGGNNQLVWNPLNCSDINGDFLMQQEAVNDHVLNIDHIVRYQDWGSNDYRNARVVTARQNQGNALPRAGNVDVICYSNIVLNGVQYNRNQVLQVGDMNTLLALAEPVQGNIGSAWFNNGQQPQWYSVSIHTPANPLTNMNQVDDSDIAAIYFNLIQ